MALETEFKDYILKKGTKRKYIITKDDNYSYITDASEYEQIGSTITARYLNDLAAAASIHVDGNIKGYSITITGDGKTKEFAFKHTLGTRDFIIQMYDMTETVDGQTVCPVVETDFRRIGIDTVQVIFSVAPTSSESYKVVMFG